MRRSKFALVAPRQQPRKRPRRHTKKLNKHKKRNYKPYARQGRRR